MTSEVTIRVGRADDFTEISRLLTMVFHDAEEDAIRALDEPIYEPDRSVVCLDGDTIVGHAGAYSRELTVPGAVLPAAHVTLVGVLPTHRRQGLLSRMMRRQLEDIAQAGREPLAVLWASETTIYPRYGYGNAAQRLRADVATREVRVTAEPLPGGRLRMIEPGKAVGELAEVYERLRPERVGWSSRDDRWWNYVLADPSELRGGATALRGVVHDAPEGLTGYALWRTKDGWDSHGPKASVEVHQVAAADPATYAALWRFLLTLDLTKSASASFLALDEPLPHLVDEPRRLGLQVGDALWVRLVDLPRALASRRYRSAVDVVIEVDDPLLPGNSGTWHLVGGPDGATCVPADRPADLACGVLELGAAYLGGTALATLAAAGRVRELTPGALEAASAAFGWRRQPSPTEVF